MGTPGQPAGHQPGGHLPDGHLPDDDGSTIIVEPMVVLKAPQQCLILTPKNLKEVS